MSRPIALLRALVVAACCAASPALATGQDHTCQGGHNCNAGAGNTASAQAAARAQARAQAIAAQQQAQRQAQAQRQSQTAQGGAGGQASVVQGANPHQTPTAYAPTIISGAETCGVPISGGGSGGLFGFALGFAVPERDCRMIRASQQAQRLGDGAVAREIMCEVPAFRDAARRAGQPCAADRAAPAAAPVDLPPAPAHGRSRAEAAFCAGVGRNMAQCQ